MRKQFHEEADKRFDAFTREYAAFDDKQLEAQLALARSLLISSRYEDLLEYSANRMVPANDNVRVR